MDVRGAEEVMGVGEDVVKDGEEHFDCLIRQVRRGDGEVGTGGVIEIGVYGFRLERDTD